MTGKRSRRGVALLPWGNVIEDYLDDIGCSVEDFAETMSGGWLFGYVEALSSAGIRPVLVCVSVGTDRPRRQVHVPTGTTLWLLPAPRVYRWLRPRLDRPYASGWREAASGRRRSAAVLQVLGWLVAPYLATPVRCLYRTLRSEGCGVAICQEYEEGRFDLVVGLCRMLRIAVIAVYQGGDRTRTPGERLVRRRSVHAATGLIIAARRELERVVTTYDLPERRIQVIANPVDIPPPLTPEARDRARRDLQLDPAVPVVVWYGRIDVHAKGLDVLVEAWQACCDQRPGRALQLLLIGDGPGAADLRHRIDSAGLRGVRWRQEYVLDRRVLATHLAAADLFAFPSRHEGFAVAPMEAMAAGLPVVAADAAGVADLLEGDAIGIVVPRDDPAAFAAGLGRLIDHPGERRVMGQKARASVAERFSVEAIGAQLGRVIAPHLARHG